MTPEDRKHAAHRHLALEAMLVTLQAQQRLTLEVLAALSDRLGCDWPPGSWTHRQAELEDYYSNLQEALRRDDGVPPTVGIGEPLLPIPPRREP